MSIGTVVTAGAGQWLLVQSFGPMPPFITFYPAVLLVAVVAGGGPGVLATALSAAVAVYLSIPPLGLSRPGDAAALSIFVGMNLVLCGLAERLRRAKETLAAARAQAELVRATMASIGEGVIASRLDGEILLLNEAAQRLLGVGEAAGSRAGLAWAFSVIDAQTREPLGDVARLIMQSPSAGQTMRHGLLVRSDGSEMPIELNGAPIRSETGEVAGVVITFRDRTERKRAEEDMQRLLETVQAEKEWFSLVLSSMSEEVYFTDTQKRYTYANHAVLREFGYDGVEGEALEEIVGKLEVFRPDGTPRPMSEAPPLRALAGEVVRDEEQIVRTPRTGELRHRIVSSSPVRDAKGEIIGSVSVVRDITQQKRVEAALREADRLKNNFFASLSHELRNPLAPIRTAARLLELPDATREDMQRCAAIISRQVAHMVSLLDDLLDAARFERGEMTLKKQRTPLRELLDAAIEAGQPSIAERRHRLHIEASSTAPVLEVDPVRLTQVISNLLTNAAKYTDPGGDITLGYRLGLDAFELFVRDTGIGLHRDMFERIFELFVRGDTSNDYTHHGLGIGLALVKGIVELHGGVVGVASEGAGRGSTFTVSLPRSVVVETEDSAETPGRAGAGRGQSVCVLIADDNVDGAQSLAMLLQASGHEVHLAYNGSQALETAARIKPRIALIDIGMPELDGYEVARRIRNEPWGREVKLVAVTGWGQDADKRAALSAGFDYHFTKPVDLLLVEALFER